MHLCHAVLVFGNETWYRLLIRPCSCQPVFNLTICLDWLNFFPSLLATTLEISLHQLMSNKPVCVHSVPVLDPVLCTLNAFLHHPNGHAIRPPKLPEPRHKHLVDLGIGSWVKAEIRYVQAISTSPRAQVTQPTNNLLFNLLISLLSLKAISAL